MKFDLVLLGRKAVVARIIISESILVNLQQGDGSKGICTARFTCLCNFSICRLTTYRKGEWKCQNKKALINAPIRAVTVLRRKARNTVARIAVPRRPNLCAAVDTRAASLA
jgi:hypothetical protein